MVRSMRPVVSALACAAMCSAAAAQPKLIITGVAGDLASSGDGVAGLVSVNLTGANANYSTVPIVWARGSGYSIINGAVWGRDGGISCAAGLSALAMRVDNTSNWGSLNCFAGYCFGSMTGCTPGAPLTPPSPCILPSLAHHWDLATGWKSTGSFARHLDAATGRYFGGTRCDQTINTAADLSGNGRYVVGSGYWAPLTTASGGPGFGLCGHFLPYRYDSVTGELVQLPSNSTTSRADHVNFDGTVISGYDLTSMPVDTDGDGTPDATNTWRQTVVWRNGTEYVIDPHPGAKDNAGISGPGTMVASGASVEFVAEQFPGQVGVRLVRWTWNGSAWSPENLGRPIDFPDPSSGVGIPFGDLWVNGVSDDGQTIVGIAQYGPPPPSTAGLRRAFIWRPSINGGVPIDLETYLRSLNPASPIFSNSFALQNVVGLSGDGNQILVSVFDQRNTCPPGFGAPRSHTAFMAGIIYLDGSSIPCDPPRIGKGPEDWEDTGGLSYGVSLNVVASGSWPLSYQWQREDPNAAGTWINLVESCQGFSTAVDWDYEGVFKNQLRIGAGPGYAGRAGRYRVVISNSCGSVSSEPATVTFTPGACCFPGGTCELAFFYTCSETFNGGSFEGSGTTCAPTVCGPRACCIDQQACVMADALTCEANEGTSGAEGSTCSPDPCVAPTTGACCRGSTCAIEPSATCTGFASSYSGNGTVCNVFGTNNVSPCCLSDFNQSGSVTVQDIFDFLSDYFSASTLADINASGTVTVQDIFDFLSLYFAGCA